MIGRMSSMRSGARRRGSVARAVAALVVLFLAFVLISAAVGTAPASARSLTVRTTDISLASPFTGGPCTNSGTGFDPGFSQETSVAVNPRDPQSVLVAWIQ